MNTIDTKSFIIGILLTATVFLSTGWQSGVQEIKIVGISKGFGQSWEAIKVKTTP